MFKVIRDGKVHEFSELHEMRKYINRSKRWGGEYVFTFDMLNIEGETWEISSSEAWEAICYMAEKNGDIKVLLEYPEINTKTTEEVQAEAPEAEEVESKNIVRVVDGYEVPEGEIISGLDSSWKSGEQIVAEVKEIYKGIQEKKKAVYHFEMAGMEVAYDSSKPCEWFGSRNYGVYTDSLKTGFHVVMYFVACNTDNIRLRYSIKDCHTGSFVVGAGNSAKAWKVDRRKPKQVFSVLGKIKAWLAKHGELAA